MPNGEFNQTSQFWSKLRFVFLDIVQTVVMALAVFVVVYLFLFQPNQVKGSSMVPTLEDGEYLLTDKLTYRWVRQPEKGDIVVFQAPENEQYDFIKRIIATPGDNIKLINGQIFVNDSAITEDYLVPTLQTTFGAFLKNNVSYTVPDGGYIVMGDNRRFSSDSREWGPVPAENIVGRAWFRYWPPTKLGVIVH